MDNSAVAKLVALLKEKGLTVSTAESCTSGLVAAKITEISGASEVFKYGAVTYCNDAKNLMVGVKKETLDAHGAVSEETASEMALGVRKAVLGSDIGISVTGLAGPHGDEGKPVGLVYIGVSSDNFSKVLENHFSGDRDEVREKSVDTAIALAIEAAKKADYKKIRYAIFDLDGTLVDPYEGVTGSINYALESIGLHEDDPEKLRSYIGPSLRETFGKYIEGEDRIEALVEKYRELYLVEGIHQNIIYDGTVDMLKYLHEHGCKVALASCKPEDSCLRILEEIGVLEYFDVVTGASFDKTLDDKESIVAESVRRLGIKPEEKENAYMVGDRYMDINGGKLSGIKAVGCAYGYGTENEFSFYGADYVIEKPIDLINVIYGEQNG